METDHFLNENHFLFQHDCYVNSLFTEDSVKKWRTKDEYVYILNCPISFALPKLSHNKDKNSEQRNKEKHKETNTSHASK